MIPKNSSFLITGGAGFIGSNLAEFLIKQGYKVTVLDNFETGSIENINGLLQHKNFKLVKGDIRILEDCETSCKNVDYVLHQAALGSISRSIENPAISNEVNVSGMLNMMIAAKNNNVKRFVYASSSSVYGDSPFLPRKEADLGNTLSPYATTKRTNELYAKNFYDIFRLPVIGLRYFNVFGERQNPNSKYSAVIPIFINSLLKNEAPTIYGNGNQSRDFTHIENVIQANLLACISDETSLGKVYNIGCGDNIKIIELYNKIAKILKADIQPNYSEKRKGDVDASYADITLSKKSLSYQPKIDIDSGLEKTINWYIENLLDTNRGGINTSNEYSQV